MTTLALHVVPPTVPPFASTPDASPQAAPSGSSDSTFHDLFSIFNPLQHIPVVSTLYRAMTGDTIGPVERVAGDTLYGGWMGLASSVANLIFEKETGKDFGASALAFAETGELPTLVAADDSHAAAGQARSVASEALQPPMPERTYGIAALAGIETGHRPYVGDASVTKVAFAKPAAVSAEPAPQSIAATPAASAAIDPAKPGAVATRVPVPLVSSAANGDPGDAALESSILSARIRPDLGQRALDAYRKSVGTPATPADLTPAI